MLAFDRKFRIVHFCLCTVALQVCPPFARGEGLTVGNIAAVLKASPVMPVQNIDEHDLIPGSPVFGVRAEQLRGIEILRVLYFDTCQVETPRQWFRTKSAAFTFTSQGTPDLEDLRSLLGAPTGSMDNIDNVQVKFDAWSLNAPFPNVQDNFAKTVSGSNCIASRNGGVAAMIIRPVLADITLTFAGRGLTKHHASAFISKMDPPPEVSKDGTFFRITLSHRLVALVLGKPP